MSENTRKDNDQLFEDLMGRDGKTKYIRKIIEELAELQLAILHYQDGKVGHLQIKEEMADVLLQIEKLAYAMDISDEDLSAAYFKKLHQLEEIVYYDPNRKDEK